MLLLEASLCCCVLPVSCRWLRFPCCGQRFACDLCHEEAVADGHDAAWATRMVCGFCSREQPLDKSCKYCGKKLATSAAQPSGRNTRFWEGGKGCRWDCNQLTCCLLVGQGHCMHVIWTCLHLPWPMGWMFCVWWDSFPAWEDHCCA